MTAPYYSDDLVTLHLGDCLDVLAGMEPCSVDAVVCDPPYGLEFMGREWDGADGFRRSLNAADAGRDSVFGRTSRTSPEYKTGKPSGARIRKASEADQSSGRAHNETTSLVSRNAPEAYVAGRVFQEWCEAWASQCLRVLKPGGFLLAFGGTRTWHRLVCGIEDAGFEIRGSTADLTGREAPGLLWVYSQGMPKNLDASRAVDMHLCPLPGRHYMRQVPAAPRAGDHVCAETEEGARWRGWGTSDKPSWEPVAVARKPLGGTLGANLVTYGTGALNIDGCRVTTGDDPGRTRNTALGVMNDDGWQPQRQESAGNDAGRWPPNVLLCEEAAAELDRQSGVLTSGANPTRRGSDKFRDAYGEFAGQAECTAHRGTDTGGASRFFPVFRYEAKAGQAERPRLADGTAWPTVKPLDLMRWLVRLVTPPGGKVLDLFAGTGTTGEACVIEGFPCVLVDKDPVAVELIMTRLRKPIQPDLFGGAA